MPCSASQEEKNRESCGTELNILLIFVAIAVIIAANINKNKGIYAAAAKLVHRMSISSPAEYVRLMNMPVRSHTVLSSSSAFDVLPLSGTPEARFLYQCAPVYSVHTKASSSTFSVLWNNRRPVLPGMKSYAHLKQHSLDN